MGETTWPDVFLVLAPWIGIALIMWVQNRGDA
jgi:hypothetical protein